MKTKWIVRTLGLFFLGACSLQCGETASDLGSETNWYKSCDDSNECGENACICGACSRSCDADADCDGLSHSVCATQGSEGQMYQCGQVAESKPGLCTPRCETARDCAAGRRCVAGSCVIDSESNVDPSDGGAGQGGSSDDDIELVLVGSLTNEQPPAACVEDLPELLPGCTENSSTWGIDCDGDSVPDYHSYDCTRRNLERPTDFGGAYDCMLDDEKLRYWVTPDADGDGYGDGSTWCAGPVVPEGYIRLTSLDLGLQDCDDADPAVYPGATDTWGDGTDSDCSNGDYPNCSLLEPGGAPDFPVEPPPAATCPGTDLYISGPAICGDRCRNDGSLFGFVGNSGAEATAGPVILEWSDSAGNSDTVELGALGPGEATPFFELPFHLVTEVSLHVVDDADCNHLNDYYVFSNPNGDQPCLF